MVIIDHEDSLFVKVVEYYDDVYPPRIHRTQEFKVSKSVLMKSSSVFEKMLGSPHFREALQDTITLEEDNVKSMEIWFKVLHENITNTYDVLVTEMWHLVVAADKYNLNITDLKTWFAEWYAVHNVDSIEPRNLLLPCWWFDHAEGFACATKTLIFNEVDQISVTNPIKLTIYHLPPCIIQQFNEAKDKLQNAPRSAVIPYDFMKNLSDCECLPDTISKYEKALSLIFDGPQQENKAEKKSLKMLLETIAKLRFDPGPPACEKFCRQKFGNLIHAAMANANFPFQGLCLDCINRSTPKSDNVDLDFWSRNSVPPSNGVGKCRLDHQEFTSYFSYMGPEEARYRFLEWMADAAYERIAKKADEEENDEEEDDHENDNENDDENAEENAEENADENAEEEDDENEDDEEADGENNDQNNDDDEMN